MRESLNHIFSNLVTLEDKTQFYYTIYPYELKNSLGTIIAVLQEYTFTRKGEMENQFTCKLYKTKEGNWYDIENTKTSAEKRIVRMLKSAIDPKESNSAVPNGE